MKPAQFVLLSLVLMPLNVVASDIDFNLDVRPILSNKCLLCHGPDPEGLQAGLRLDKREAATVELDSGVVAVVPGKPDESELIARILSDDEDLRMPPVDHGARLTDAEIAILRQWINQGAPYAVHWAYVKPTRPVLPLLPEDLEKWCRNPIDRFVAGKLLERDLSPSPEADRYSLARRVALDLTGLPPTVEEVDAFVASTDPQAYEKLVDTLLQRQTFGEHWARKWLDLARYADSAGYADDPPRTIWAYRDWVIRAINSNMPFDQFTMEQLAGDLLPEPSESQLIATAFHRNTLTNNEGGTQDEEFRNVAVVDRVNTTMAVWMGTTMACAQCHTHKYDPITQEEYFRFFAVFNNTDDSDRRDESPKIEIYTDEQRQKKRDLEADSQRLRKLIATPTPELVKSQANWEKRLNTAAEWNSHIPSNATRDSKLEVSITDGGIVVVDETSAKDVYRIEVSLTDPLSIAALQLQTLPDPALPSSGTGLSEGNFVITGISAQVVPIEQRPPKARFVRITNPGKDRILSLAEVQVFSDGTNVAVKGVAEQSSTGFNGPAGNAIDGNTDGDYLKMSVTHTAISKDPWWEVDLGTNVPIEKLSIWNRTDNNLQSRLANFTVELLNESREVIWSEAEANSPKPSKDFLPGHVRDVKFTTAFADYHQPDFEAQEVLTGRTGNRDGWAIGGQTTIPHSLTLVPKKTFLVEEPSILRVVVEQNSPHVNHLVGRLRIRTTADTTAIHRSKIPKKTLAILDMPTDARNETQSAILADYYRSQVAPELADQRKQLVSFEKRLANLKPATSVPVLREKKRNRRVTHLQHRGSYLDQGQQVVEGVPAVFHPVPEDTAVDRLVVAEWLASPENPLTGRVIANRYWETIFGRGIVLTSEEFGSQGELPTHPELLDWLASELIHNGWNTKELIRMLVTSSAYRQTARVTQESLAADPDNRWLSRGPRVRLSAEMVRDQALSVSGLLSDRMFGPPVNPPQPDMGLKAAFGGSTDWKTSTGEDRYRRGLYTTWRRSNPYPSMATFDAPNREVCTVRRNSTNTPLQSLVTLNDPVYVEAAQSLARLALSNSGQLRAQLQYAFRRCLLRPPSDAELKSLAILYQDSHKELSDQPEEATSLATEPLGELPEHLDAVDAAAMTVVCNVLLNLDEMFLKR